jgi:hypothetical protein
LIINPLEKFSIVDLVGQKERFGIELFLFFSLDACYLLALRCLELAFMQWPYLLIRLILL